MRAHLVLLGYKSNFTWKTIGNSKIDSEIGLVLVIANVSVITGSGVVHGTHVVTLAPLAGGRGRPVSEKQVSKWWIWDWNWVCLIAPRARAFYLYTALLLSIKHYDHENMSLKRNTLN